MPLYQRLLGDAWVNVAAPIQSIHTTDGSVLGRGRFRIDHGPHLAARLIARILQLPEPGASVDTTLAITAGNDGEDWLRTFDGHPLQTRQFATDDRELAERFRVFEIRFRIEGSRGSLFYIQRRAAVVMGPVRVPLPAALAPHVEAREDPAGPATIEVRVRVSLPALGTLIAYQGLIEVEPTTP
jgi:hypothetical protein